MDKIDGLRMRFRAAARVAQHKGVRDQHVTSAGPCATHVTGPDSSAAMPNSLRETPVSPLIQL